MLVPMLSELTEFGLLVLSLRRIGMICKVERWCTCWEVIECEDWESEVVWLGNAESIAYGNVNSSKTTCLAI